LRSFVGPLRYLVIPVESVVFCTIRNRYKTMQNLETVIVTAANTTVS